MDISFTHLGLRVPDILLPSSSTDLAKWATIACDQYTSEQDYWTTVEKTVGDSPSTYHIVYPEIYLHTPDEAERIASIQETMRAYLTEGVIAPVGPGFILVERILADGRRRIGLMAALDLEAYDFSPNSRSLIRPTEGTIVDRIPPRLRIREGAALESPHIMVLMDDPGASVLNPLIANKDQLPLAYDTELMLGGGHVRGYHIREEKWLAQLADALTNLLAEKSARCGDPLLFAIGDGNHSLATAQAYWDNIKKNLSPAERESHPARYALVEIQNIHDPGIHFEPIHRVLFSVNPGAFKDALLSFYRDQKCTVRIEAVSASDIKRRIIPPADNSAHSIALFYGDRCELVTISPGLHHLPAGTIQRFLDIYLSGNPGSKIDYIHGRKALTGLAQKPDTVGVCLPQVSKHSFFETIVTEGVMPQKTFSMGEAEEKRYYLECRRIQP